MTNEYLVKTGLMAVAALVVFSGGVFTGAKSCNPRRTATECTETVSVQTRIDTVRIPVPQPARVEVVARTVEVLKRVPEYITLPGDSCAVEIPITQKEYHTPEFRATIQGYKPELLDVTVFPKTITVTKVKKPRFSITAGAGLGWNGERITPTIGVAAGFVLWSK